VGGEVEKSLSPENRQVMQEILGYIAKHPDAGDTFQNIAEWWIPFERLLASWKALEEVLAYLTARGVMTETVLPGGEKFYKANPDQHARIAQFLQEVESDDFANRALKINRKEVKGMELLRRLIVEEDGQNIAEYTLMIGLVVLMIWVAVVALGIPAAITTIWTNVRTQLQAAAS
jgi:Flp pilus assembly pilin Flp